MNSSHGTMLLGMLMMACGSQAADGATAPSARRKSDLTADARQTVHRNLTYAVVDGNDLQLDLVVPAGDRAAPPLVVFIHGGGWRKGSRRNNRCRWLADHGYAVASVSYRLTDVAIFPAQIHDVKAAVRWLRAHAVTYGYDARRVGVAGSSAGGHLAALLGTTSTPPALDGKLGKHRGESSAVQAVINYFGPTDFPLRRTSNPKRHLTPAGGSFLFLGGREYGEPDPTLERQASPVTYVNTQSPPMIVLQGLADAVVKPDQAAAIEAAYKRHGAPIEVVYVEGAGHGAKKLFEGECREKALQFLHRHLHQHAKE